MACETKRDSSAYSYCKGVVHHAMEMLFNDTDTDIDDYMEEYSEHAMGKKIYSKYF